MCNFLQSCLLILNEIRKLLNSKIESQEWVKPKISQISQVDDMANENQKVVSIDGMKCKSASLSITIPLRSNDRMALHSVKYFI